MNAYIWQGDIYCEACAQEIREDLMAQDDYDPTDLPDGPYADGGGEADSPHHCGSCGIFLENGLTAEGVQYVKEAIKEDLREGRDDSVAATVWRDFYGPFWEDDDDEQDLIT